jgi:hypothetical protein
MSADSEAHQETISMILASMPVPPLAQSVMRGDDSIDGFSSSHDTIAASMIHVMRHADQKHHENRRLNQLHTLQAFATQFAVIENTRLHGGFEDERAFCRAIYQKLCAYTRAILAINDPHSRAPDDLDVRFEDYDNIRDCKKGESAFDEVYSHLSALLIIINNEYHPQQTDEIGIGEQSNTPEQIKLAKPQDITYDNMLRMYLVHAWI